MDTLSLNFESKTDGRVLTEQNWIHAVHAMPAGKKHLFFDEVQEFAGWEKIINSFLIDGDCDIYITGSNAKMLSGELATYPGGLYVEIKVYPFSFREVSALVKTLPYETGALSEQELFTLYLKRGGFPFLYNYNFDDSGTPQYLAPWQNLQGKELLQTQGKNYIADHGLRAAAVPAGVLSSCR